MLRPESTLSFLRLAMLERVTVVGWIDGLQVGTLPLREIVARADDVRSALMSCLYCQADHAINDRSFWAYYG